MRRPERRALAGPVRYRLATTRDARRLRRWLLGTAALLLASAAQADDDDRALSQLARQAHPAPTLQRGMPLDSLAWERRLRPADRLGPTPLRPADTALLQAARQARWADALALVASGQASANAQDEAHGSALVLAARAGQDELVRALVQRGADLDRAGEDGFTALGAAAFTGQRSTLRLLLRAGADAQRWGSTGQTALHLASVAGRLDCLDELLRAGVPVDQLNRQRETALDSAANVGQQDAMERLLRAGADTRLAGQR